MALLIPKEKYTLDSPSLGSNYLVAVDDQRRFYVATGMRSSIEAAEARRQSLLGAVARVFRPKNEVDDDDESHEFVTYNCVGQIERQVNVTASTLVLGMGLTSDMWATPAGWAKLHREHDVFATEGAPLHFGEQRPIRYARDIRSNYLCIGKLDADYLQECRNPYFVEQSQEARRLKSMLHPLEDNSRVATLSLLESAGFDEVLGVYADVPKAWTYVSEDLCIVLRDRRLLVTADNGEEFTVQTVLLDAVLQEADALKTTGMPLDDMGWVAETEQFFRTSKEFFAEQQSQRDDIEVRRIEVDESAIRRLFEQPVAQRDVLPGFVAKLPAGFCMLKFSWPFAAPGLIR